MFQMAKIDKRSVRSELERIRTSFEDLSSKGEVSKECAALFESLLSLFRKKGDAFREDQDGAIYGEAKVRFEF